MSDVNDLGQTRDLPPRLSQPQGQASAVGSTTAAKIQKRVKKCIFVVKVGG